MVIAASLFGTLGILLWICLGMDNLNILVNCEFINDEKRSQSAHELTLDHPAKQDISQIKHLYLVCQNLI